VKLYVDTKFERVSLDRFIEIYFSEDFNLAVAPVSGLKTRKLVDEKRVDDGSRLRRVLIEPNVTLPGAIQKALDTIAGGKGAAIRYDEVTDYDAKSKTAKYFIDSKINDRVKVAGMIKFVADGSGARRILDGVIEIKAPLIAGMIEKFIEAETQKGYAKIGSFLQKWIDEHP
jgi:hypothetical protein